ncbi:MAG: DinB family protein [Proteiniphilum sp.]
MKRQQVLDKIDRAWREFNDSFTGLTETQMRQSGVTSEWSVKDIIAHVNTWEEEALKYLPVILKGGRLPRYSDMYGGIDAFNALMTEQKRTLTLAEILTRLNNVHEQLIEYLQTIPEEEFRSGSRIQKRVRWDTYAHYPMHTQAIHTWRERLSEKNS